MYKRSREQKLIFENPTKFIGAKLDSANGWIQIASLITWGLVDNKYSNQWRK